MSNSRPLRILALHGFKQNGILLEKILKPLEDSLGGVAKITYATGPHDASRWGVSDASLPIMRNDVIDGKVEENELAQQAWWVVQIRQAKDLKDEFIETLSHLKEIFEQQGPFDGLIGFSQGACLCGLVVAALQTPTLLPESFRITHPPIRFAIIISGFSFPWPFLETFYETPFRTRSLHVIAANDKIVGKDRSEDFVECWEGESRVIYHENGHRIPMDPKFVMMYKDFIMQEVTGVVVRSQM